MSTRPVVTVPDPRWTGLWDDGRQPVELSIWDMRSACPVDPVLVVLPYMDPAPILHRLPELTALQVVQTLTARYDDVLQALPAGVTLANGAGIHDSSTAELAVGLAIAALRGLGDFARAQTTGRWGCGTRTSLADRRVLLIGSGSVGGAIADRLAPFEVELTLVASRARDDARGRVHGVDELPALLPHAEVVVLACPLTERTRGLVDAGFLAALPDGAALVNVSRGPVVVTDALLAELVAGRLVAALDVTDPEPLPPGHPLWTAPNLLISPHVGGNSTAFPARGRALLVDQLERFAAGRPLRNVVAGPPR